MEPIQPCRVNSIAIARFKYSGDMNSQMGMLQMNTENWAALRPQQDQDTVTKAVDKPPQKAYLIAHVEVTDAQRYGLCEDIEEDAFARYGGRFLVRGGVQTPLIGNLKTRTVVIEFDSLAAAVDCYHSPENQSAKAVRLSFAAADAVIVEGYTDL